MKIKQKEINSIKINDIFDELNEENKRLENELKFANNCLKVLVKYKQYLNKIYAKFGSLIDSEDKQELYRLEEEFNLVNKSEEQTIGSNVEIKVQNNKEIDENDNQFEDLNSDRKTEDLIEKTFDSVETDVRRSGKTQQILCKVPELHRNPNSKSKPESVPNVVEIPDPEVEPNSLLLLQRNNFDEKTESYVCPNPFCHKSCGTSQALYKHFHYVHYSTKKFLCNHLDCNKRFKTRNQLTTHQTTHSDIRPFVCDFNGCDFSCKFQTILEKHQLVHTNELNFKCSECQKLFKSMVRLKKHQRLHETKPSFKCRFDGCNQLFWRPNHLVNHQISSHNLKRKIHYCEWPGCDYWTRILSRFRGHQRIHTGEKPHVCEWPGCGHQFRLKHDLNQHLLIHKDIKPYGCVWPGCQYRCRQSSTLKQHMRVHQK